MKWVIAFNSAVLVLILAGTVLRAVSSDSGCALVFAFLAALFVLGAAAVGVAWLGWSLA